MLFPLVLLGCSATPPPAPPGDPGDPGDPGPAAPWIPPQCYAKSTDAQPRNPCFACHQRGRRPNTLDDSAQQLVYDFPGPAHTNPWTNLFADRSYAVAALTDDAIDAWVRESNTPPPEMAWGAHFRVDADGWDRDADGKPTGWRSYRSPPFPGFFPTNGSWGDTFVRLPEAYRPDLETYAVNLAILDAVVQRRDIAIDPTDEARWGVDLDLDGRIGTATQVTFRYAPGDQPMRWEGAVGGEPPTAGLFPEGTELLHSVRYLDPTAPVRMAPRMKELRYMRKTRWRTMADIASVIAAEEKERLAYPERLEPLVGDPDVGLANGQGWRLRGRIEAEDGTLRSQTTAELAYCIGCHGGVGVTTDTVFSYPRRTAWGHGHDMPGGPDALRADGKGEYGTYLAHALAGDDYGANDEVRTKFFTEGRELAWEDLQRDIRVLVLPSATRARDLNRGYRVLVDEQSYVRGRDAVWGLPEERVWREVPPKQPTGVKEVVLPAWLDR